MIINLPANAKGFSMEVALGCWISAACTNGENVSGLITLQTNNAGETTTLGNASTHAFVNNSSTVGEFTFFGFTTDQSSIAWIDLTPSSPAAVVMARFTYATELTSSSGGGGPVPEPAPGWLFAAGLVLLATHRLKRRS
jgi:MYXO-CTERM domain-containing protein